MALQPAFGVSRVADAPLRRSYILLDATVGALGFYLLGYGFAYGDKVKCDPCWAAAQRRAPHAAAPVLDETAR